VVFLLNHFLELSETFVAAEAHALKRLGVDVSVIASVRAESGNPADAAGLEVSYWEDETSAQKLRGLIWLLSRHPLACLRDLIARRRWRGEEEVYPLAALAPTARRLARTGARHVHVHFACESALSAMRIHMITGIPYSVTAHAFDIFQRPANLAEKIERAAFVTSGCDYNVDYLRAAVPGSAVRIHKIVMGVDGDRFRRQAPQAGGRTVIAIGRLVEKKGFGDLIEAAALLARRAPLDRVRILGEGPLRGELEALIAARGLEGVVELIGSRPPEEVRAALETADLLAMPCVVAPDGDRDSMPVVVKEALAMEIPVVATDEVGLPEVVRPGWGRLVPPADPAALADAIAEVLALEPAERARMGEAGREFVLVECDVDAEARRLSELIAAVS
jgi:glycosyltransferase involved in cell wall biosynthesis